jgi:hypothetical protein
MNLPVLKVRLMPNCQCIRCGQHGYVADKCQLCIGCLNIALLIYAKKKKAERK